MSQCRPLAWQVQMRHLDAWPERSCLKWGDSSDVAMLTQVLVAHRRPDSPPLRAMPEFWHFFHLCSFFIFPFTLFLLRGFSVSVWLPCVDAYTVPGLCSRFLIEQRFLKQQSVAGAGAQLSSAALRSPASPALRLQPAAQIGELCNMRCSVSWPSGSMEARNPEKIHQKFAEKCKIRRGKFKKLKKSEIQLFNRENVLAIFDEKIEIRDRFQTGAKECIV